MAPTANARSTPAVVATVTVPAAAEGPQPDGKVTLLPVRKTAMFIQAGAFTNLSRDHLHRPRAHVPTSLSSSARICFQFRASILFSLARKLASGLDGSGSPSRAAGIRSPMASLNCFRFGRK